MTLDDFQIASFERKCDWIVGNTTYLISREEREFKIYLYHTSDFFVEVYYSTIVKRVSKINAFKDPFFLELFLEEIEISNGLE